MLFFRTVNIGWGLATKFSEAIGLNDSCIVRKGKGKVIPLQARCGPEGG